MNLLSQNKYIMEFLVAALNSDLEGSVSCDELAKSLKTELPDVFQRAKIQKAPMLKHKGTKHITWSNIKNLSWFHKLWGTVDTRCAIICWEGPMDAKLHCMHVRVSYLDEGYIIHGTYN